MRVRILSPAPSVEIARSLRAHHLGLRLAAGHRALNARTQVRTLEPQPSDTKCHVNSAARVLACLARSHGFESRTWRGARSPTNSTTEGVTMSPHILTLDVAGAPHQWINVRAAAHYYATDMVAWATGTNEYYSRCLLLRRLPCIVRCNARQSGLPCARSVDFRHCWCHSPA